MAGKSKYYTVWEGVNPGVYDSWVDCQLQIKGYTGAKYKSFATREEAEEALNHNFWKYASTKKEHTLDVTKSDRLHPSIIDDAIAVDASCLGNPGKMEYRGVYVLNKQELFRVGPFNDGTNNIGEFLAIVHALAWMKQRNMQQPLYTDSVNAMSWITNKKCKTKLERTGRNDEIFDLIARAETWLKNNTFTNRIIKWETKTWGEIPADFGRK